MRYSLLVTLLLLLITAPSSADIPVYDPDARLDPRVTQQSLEALLKPLSEVKKTQRVQRLLQTLYRERRLSQQIIKNIEGLTAEFRNDPKFRQEYEKRQQDVKTLNASETVLKNWLGQRGIKAEPERGPTFRIEKKGSSNLEGSPVVSSTHLIALAFLAGGALFGLRRVLA